MEVDVNPWEELGRAFSEAFPVFAEASCRFTGLLAILNGHSGPPRLCIDGREYHRRQRSRTKRGGKR